MTDEHREDSKTDFRKKLDALIGQPTGGSGKPTVAPDPVNQPMIRHWAYALADMNPVYLDPEFAEKSRFGGIVSPPVMLQAWTMPAPKIEGIAERGGVPIEMGSNNPQRSSKRPATPASWPPTRSSRSSAIRVSAT